MGRAWCDGPLLAGGLGGCRRGVSAVWAAFHLVVGFFFCVAFFLSVTFFLRVTLLAGFAFFSAVYFFFWKRLVLVVARAFF